VFAPHVENMFKRIYMLENMPKTYKKGLTCKSKSNKKKT
jgi:hypothetical protein